MVAEDTSSSMDSTEIWTIVGSVIGGLAVLGVLIWVIIKYAVPGGGALFLFADDKGSDPSSDVARLLQELMAAELPQEKLYISI